MTAALAEYRSISVLDKSRLWVYRYR
jgi:hypothetical protein